MNGIVSAANFRSRWTTATYLGCCATSSRYSCYCKNHQTPVEVNVRSGVDHARLASYVSRRGRPSSAGTESVNDGK